MSVSVSRCKGYNPDAILFKFPSVTNGKSIRKLLSTVILQITGIFTLFTHILRNEDNIAFGNSLYRTGVVEMALFAVGWMGSGK